MKLIDFSFREFLKVALYTGLVIFLWMTSGTPEIVTEFVKDREHVTFVDILSLFCVFFLFQLAAYLIYKLSESLLSDEIE